MGETPKVREECVILRSIGIEGYCSEARRFKLFSIPPALGECRTGVSPNFELCPHVLPRFPRDRRPSCRNGWNSLAESKVGASFSIDGGDCARASWSFASRKRWAIRPLLLSRRAIARKACAVMCARLLSLLACVVLASASVSPASRPTLMSNTSAAEANLSPEVRLRKLHLVRPDLIPYPIQLDIYC
jgi:hypothetical protein